MSTVNIMWNLSLNVGSISFGHPSPVFNSVRTASGFRLDFPASISLLPHKADEPAFLIEGMELCLKPIADSTEVAVVRCPDSMVSGYAPRNVTFSWDGTFAALAIYERIRSNKEPQFSVKVKGKIQRLLKMQGSGLQVATSPAEIFQAETTITYSRDSWVSTLRQIGFQDCVIVEIPYPSDSPHQWEPVWNALRDARNAFDKGGSTACKDSATSVRLALERWRDIEKEDMGPGWKPPSREERESRTTSQRIDNIRWHLMQLAHESAHTGAENWTRDEALLLVCGLSALIAVRKP